MYENRANFNTIILTIFQENSQALSLNLPQAVCQHTAYSPTLLVSGLLAAGR